MHSSVEQLHLYDPAGHLKRCQEVLQDSLQEAAAAEGRTLVLKVRSSAFSRTFQHFAL
jgi:hypothetical protein